MLTDYFYGRCRLVSIYSQFTLSAVVELELHYNSLTTETSTFQKMQIFQGKRSLLMVCATHFTASSKQTAGDQGNLLKSKAVAGLWCSTVNFSVTSFCANSNHLGNTSFSVATGGCQRVSSPVWLEPNTNALAEGRSRAIAHNLELQPRENVMLSVICPQHEVNHYLAAAWFWSLHVKKCMCFSIVNTMHC